MTAPFDMAPSGGLARTATVTKLRLHQVSKSFAHVRRGTTALKVLDKVDIRVRQGEFLCLLGPSGCGKSTVLNLLAGFDLPDEGQISLDGSPLSGPDSRRGMVFQQANLFPWLTVLDNVCFGPRMARQSAQAYQTRAQDFLQRVGLAGYADHYPWQLSGGMRQRVALARAWMTEPEVLLMDEPFGALDAQTRLVMQELLTKLWRSTGTTIVFVTHDVDEALRLGDRIVLMRSNPGRIADVLTVPFSRPRSEESLLDAPQYPTLKRHILQHLRQESRHLFESDPQ